MSFSSQLYPGEIIIDDSTPEEVHSPAGLSKGLDLSLRGLEANPYGDLATEFPAELEYPDSELEARIQELEERKERISDLIRFETLPEKDQQHLNFCWAFGPTQCVEVTRALMGEKYESLSPSSFAGPMKNYRNVGGWGKEALEQIVKGGIMPTRICPDCTLDPKYQTPENKRIALDYRITEWWVLKPRNARQLLSLLLRRRPGAHGANFWSHEVMACDPLWLDGAPAIRIRNQWKGYGDSNFAVLKGSRMLPDDLVAPRLAMGM